MCISPAIYAMVGAASSLTGVTRLTVACVVIMFEVTGGVANVVPVMIGVMCAKWAGDACSNHNIAVRP
jgi:chloride channel 3/4/5